jgi:hypothetical protein
MARYHYPNRRAAEERFPHKVDIVVPVQGLGRTLALMHEWCRENVADGEWAEHGYSNRPVGKPTTDYARFYFLKEADAAAFNQRWL